MADRVYNRRFERIERIHDEQDTLIPDLERCRQMKASFNSQLLKKEFEVVIPPGTSEAAQLCFIYATRRVGERPIVNGHTILFK